MPRDPVLGFFGLGLALALITIGLLTSTLHLGRPERAWRALSQWRTSWLSREGVAAIVTYVPAGALGLGWVFGEFVPGQIAWAPWLSVPCALVTLWCTGMIYASLPTIRAWNQPLVAPVYVVAGAGDRRRAADARCLLIFGHDDPLGRRRERVRRSLLGAILKRLYWTAIDTAPRKPTRRRPPPGLAISARCGRSIRRTPSRIS